MLCCAGGGSGVVDCHYPNSQWVLSCGGIGSNPMMSPGECYSVTMSWFASNVAASFPLMHCIQVTCNSNIKFNCAFSCKYANSGGGSLGTMTVKYGDVVGVTSYTEVDDTCKISSVSSAIINSVTQVSGCFCLGKSCDGYTNALVAQTYSGCIPPEPPVEF